MSAPATTPRRVIPIASADAPRRQHLQTRRTLFQAGFFVLFILAPVFNLLRYDLVAGHAWFLGMPWHIGLDDFAAGRIDAAQAATQVLLKLLLPILATAALVLGVAWRWGRLYCGWLCPHFSVVETVNRLMRRASGKHSVWDAHPGPLLHDGNERWLIRPNGSTERLDARWWFVVVPFAVGFAFIWAVVLLTYLLPPFEIYHNLFSGTLTRNQALFIGVATVVLSGEFLFARHLFCRYGCAVGMLQSVAWIANRRAMVVGFARERAADCATCPQTLGAGETACADVCPMRLNPRDLKRRMFACTQCAQCVVACDEIQADNPQGSLLAWTSGDAAARREGGFAHEKRRE